MRRLLAWGALALSLAACERPADEPLRSRVETVQTRASSEPATAWCDRFYAPAAAPAFELPAAEPVPPGGARLPAHPGRYLWVNLWATWCKPCLREMPLVLQFADALRSDGVAIDSWLVSLDDDPAALAAHLRAHPEMAKTPALRLLAADDLTTWTERYGLTAGTSIPINVIVAPDGRVRCLRAGSIAEGDYARIRSLFRAL